jgi:hypothetical protein
MTNRFYNIEKLSTKELKRFFKDAVMLSYDTHIDKLDCDISWLRQTTNEKTIKGMIDNCSKSYHNTCIDRSLHSRNESHGEIGYTTITQKAYYLYIFVTLENLKALTDKYKLTLKEY